jgi:hypothetical protein
MKTIYISHLNKFLATDGSLYTEDELNFIEEVEYAWNENKENFNFKQIMEIFPDAIKPARRGLKAQVRNYKSFLSKISDDQETYYNEVISKVHFSKQTRVQEASDAHFELVREKVESKIKACMYRLSFLDQLEGKVTATKIDGFDEADINHAKEFSIRTFYEGELKVHGSRAVGRCPFHEERTASFTVYLKQNSWYCYGCNEGGSVIDFVMLKYNIDFLSAVKHILK